MSGVLLIELWDDLKPFVSAKDRTDAADVLVKFFDENNMLEDVQYQTGFDKFLLVALADHIDLDDGGSDGDLYDQW